MSRQKDREEFIHIMSQEGVSLSVARSFLRSAASLHRLAEAQCNGDYPFDNGERKVEPCAKCEMGCVKWAMTRDKATGQRICPDCRITQRVQELARRNGLGVIINGDPRGAVLIVTVPSGRTNDWGKRGIVAG